MDFREQARAVETDQDLHRAHNYVRTEKKVELPRFTKPYWFDQKLKQNYTNECREVVRLFVTGKLEGRYGTYGHGGPQSRDKKHVYFTKNNGSELWMHKKNSLDVKVCVAKKANGVFVGNSSSLWHARNVKTRRIYATRGGPLKIQTVLTEVMPMVPFLMFKEARLDINTFHLIDRGPDEKLDLGLKVKGETVMTHFMGAMVFRLEVRKRSKGIEGQSYKYYLFDIDRNDVRLKNFNAFLSQLGREVSSVDDAYKSLKPKEVYEAEKFLGHECPRQGEWFFIPVQGEHKNAIEKAYHPGRPRNVEAVLQSKGNRAHYVKHLSEEGYVKGEVTHGGREHKPIILETWHKAVPNTAIGSFKISGAVD